MRTFSVRFAFGRRNGTLRRLICMWVCFWAVSEVFRDFFGDADQMRTFSVRFAFGRRNGTLRRLLCMWVCFWAVSAFFRDFFRDADQMRCWILGW